MNKTLKRSSSLIGGLAVFILLLLLKPYTGSTNANIVLAIAALMITWWVTEALPMPVVALLPLILFPLLGVCKIDEAAAAYANPVIYLFMGGFMIALAIEKWNLHRRGALSIIKLTGTSGNRIVLGFIMATGLLSMWLSNTATTMMMYPIALSVINVMENNKQSGGNINNLGICLMLAIAYASNFGGIATIVGTPPNVAYVAYLEKSGAESIQFIDWMKICMPLSILLLMVLYFVMTKILYPTNIQQDSIAGQMITTELKGMGKLSRPEQRVLIIFLITATLWIAKGMLNNIQSIAKLDDTMIAVFGGLLLFISPSGLGDDKPLLEWQDTHKLPWGILILFGGGISLAGQLEEAGLIQSLGGWIAGFATGGILLVFIITIVSIFVSEVMSNVAQVIVFAPVIGGLAAALHVNPLQLGLAMTLGASCAGMLPMGTPPTAIVFASGKLKLKHMTTTGFIMNIVSAVLISLFCWYVLPWFVQII